MDQDKDLEELNREESKYYVGGVVFVAITTVLGCIGNLHVLFIYTLKMKTSNPRTFILCLAVMDFITSSVGMPFIIYDLTHPLTFTLVPACKILRFLNYFICISSSFILLVIAIDRYRKVCAPLKRQISHGEAKYMCLIAIALALAVSWPAPVLYGHSSVNTTNPNITGVRCFTEDKFKNTPYQAYFNYVLILIFYPMFCILVILYILIARAISRHTKFVKSFRTCNSPHVQKRITKKKSSEQHDEIVLKCIHLHDIRKGSLVLVDSPRSSTADSGEYSKSHSSHSHDSQHFHHIKKTTFTMFLITLCFFVSYFPHLSLKIVVFVKVGFVQNMDFTGKILYNTFVWCFFLNNISNSFIYGFSDKHFSSEVKGIYRRIFFKVRQILNGLINRNK